MQAKSEGGCLISFAPEFSRRTKQLQTAALWIDLKDYTIRIPSLSVIRASRYGTICCESGGIDETECKLLQLTVSPFP